MVQYILKLAISALTIVIVSEVGKRVSWLAALIASLPLTSILAICWLYLDTKNTSKVIDLTQSIAIAIVPSLIFFIVFPLMLKNNISFITSLIISIGIMFCGYLLYTLCMKLFLN